MLKTFALRGREEALVVYGPHGLKDLLGSLKRVVGRLSYELRVVELEPGDSLERKDYRLTTFSVDHGVRALGWSVIEETRPGRFEVEAAEALGVPNGPERGRLQNGEAITLADGRTIGPDEVLGPPRAGRKLVYTGDTAPCEPVVEAARGAEVLITEATFSEAERERALETRHQTAAQAAEVARDADVGLLALTHLSNRYFGPEIAEEARAIFPETVVPRDFDVVEVPYPERGSPRLVKAGALPRREPQAVSSAPQ
jgi:ribonuclease Z